MPDLWQECSCDEELMCSREDRLDLEQELEALRNLDEPLDQGFEINGSDDKMWMWAARMEIVEELPESFMLKLGALIAKARLPFWSFSYSNCASRVLIGQMGGGRFRIYPDGSIEFMREIWPSDESVRKMVISLLDDDKGICAKGYEAMVDVVKRDYLLDDVLARVEATDDRFYLPEGWDGK